MHRIVREFRRPAVRVLVLALACGAVPAAMAEAGRSAEPEACEIRASPAGDAVTLTALAHADRGAEGSYAFRVEGDGTNIRQGGEFRAATGRPERLGTVTLGTDGGASYRARLDVTVDGETASCTKRIGGRL